MNDALASINKWFRTNKLALNFEKTNFVKFVTKHNTYPSLNIGFEDKLIAEVETHKFLGLQVDNTLNWKITLNILIPN
jgi:hypothetical protein